MSYTRNDRIICDECGKFCSPYDEYTPFGCSNPEEPEPYEPLHACKKCHEIWFKYWDTSFKNKRTYLGDWQKSKAEIRAAKKHKLVWIHDSGFPQSEPDCLKRKYYQYVTREEWNKYECRKGK